MVFIKNVMKLHPVDNFD